MNPREQRGLELANAGRINQKGETWYVKSQNGNGRYRVRLDGDSPRCTCPDQRVPAGALQAHPRRPIHPRTGDQAGRYDHCYGIQEPAQTFGRPRLSLKDMVFSAAFKVYSTVSARRCMSDLHDARAKGYISKAPHYNSLINYFEMPELAPILRDLITESSLPLKAVETDFAVDASGFSTSRFVRWYDARYGGENYRQDWLKVHLMVGTKTNVVTSVEITGGYEHESPFFPALIEDTARNFKLEEVSADKAYSSRKNLQLVADKGATPYVPFKPSNRVPIEDSVWKKMYHYYHYRRDEFLTHYHKRSNVESTFSTIKAKFGERIRSKTDAAQMNEMLQKFSATTFAW